jgi:multiple sugar transport system substrate-binding protein
MKEYEDLFKEVANHQLDRRSFMQKAAALGLIGAGMSALGTGPAFASPAGAGGTAAAEAATAKAAWKALMSSSARGKADPAWRGKTFNIGVYDGGPKGAISGPCYWWAPYFEQYTGAKVNVVRVPFADLHTKFFTDILTGAGSYDLMIGAGWFLGDYLRGHYIRPVDQYFNDPRFTKWDRGSVSSQIARLLQGNGHWYACRNDADAQVLYWRNDVLTDPKWNQQFKAQHGKDIPVPPRTWEDLLQVATFFNGKKWTKDGSPGYGITLPLKVGEQGFFHFLSVAGSYVVLPGNNGKADRYHNVYYFDPETMDPLINTPGNVRALETMQKLAKQGPPAMTGYALAEGWNVFLRGKSIFVWSWGDVGALAEDPRSSNILGLWGAGGMPGTMEVYNRQTGNWQKMSSPNLVANTEGASWYGVIPITSKQPELAYEWSAIQASTPINFWNVTIGWTGINPGSKYDYLPPFGTSRLSDWTKVGWNGSDATAYMKAYQENFFEYKVAQEYLQIPGATQFFTQLDIHVSEALTGQATAKQALDRTASDWNNILGQLGRDSLKTSYQDSIHYNK